MRGLLQIQFVAGVLLLWAAPCTAQQPDSTVVVPQLVGSTPAQARAALERLGLILAAVDTAASRSAGNSGRIIAQKPAAGSKTNRGSRVSVVVAAPATDPTPEATTPPALVPDVIGLSLNDANRKLADARLKPGSISERDDFEKPAGTVLDQKPRAGDPVPRSGTVDLLVASAWTEVPSLNGLIPDRAGAVLSGRQLQLGATRDTTAATTTGTIVNQTPAAGTRVRKQSSVSVDVAIARPEPEPTPQDTLVPVPAITQRTLRDADALLRAAQLRLGPVTGSDAANARAGVIVGQQPQAGTRVKRNSPVAVTVATDSTVVPALTGRSIDEARALLSRSSLMAGPIDSLRGSQAPGTVIQQSPPAQRRVPKRSAVSLTVALPPLPPVPPRVPPQDTNRVEVPDLRGLTADSAATVLQLRRLGPGTAATDPAGGTPDRVIRQSPAARALVPPGSAVDLVFSVMQQPQPPAPVPPAPSPAPVESTPAPRPVNPPAGDGFPWTVVLTVAGMLGAVALGLALRARTSGRAPAAPPVVRPPTRPETKPNAAGQLTYDPVQDSPITELHSPKELTQGFALEFVGEPALQPAETELQLTGDRLEGTSRE